MAEPVKLPLLNPYKFKPSPYFQRHHQLNFIDCVPDSPSTSATDLRGPLLLPQMDIQRELNRFKVRQRTESPRHIPSMSPNPTYAYFKRSSPVVYKALNPTHLRSRSTLAAVLPTKPKPLPVNRLPKLRPVKESQDQVEQYFDDLIRNRQALQNPQDLTNLPTSKRRRLKDKTRGSFIADSTQSSRPRLVHRHASSISPSSKRVLSKQDVSFMALQECEGEEYLKKKMGRFHREIDRMMGQVEEYIVRV
jgi:hypothetical protein